MSIIAPYSKNNITTIVTLSCLVPNEQGLENTVSWTSVIVKKLYSLCPWLHKKRRFCVLVCTFRLVDYDHISLTFSFLIEQIHECFSVL